MIIKVLAEIGSYHALAVLWRYIQKRVQARDLQYQGGMNRVKNWSHCDVHTVVQTSMHHSARPRTRRIPNTLARLNLTGSEVAFSIHRYA